MTANEGDMGMDAEKRMCRYEDGEWWICILFSLAFAGKARLPVTIMVRNDKSPEETKKEKKEIQRKILGSKMLAKIVSKK